MAQSSKTEFDEKEALQRFEAALRGAFKTPSSSAKIMAPKKTKAQQQKGKPAKASLSSRASRASAKTERP